MLIASKIIPRNPPVLGVRGHFLQSQLVCSTIANSPIHLPPIKLNMKLALLTGLALGAVVAVKAADPAPAKTTNSPDKTTNAPAASAEASSVLKNDVDKFSYSL